jgi:hypothetical protein
MVLTYAIMPAAASGQTLLVSKTLHNTKSTLKRPRTRQMYVCCRVVSRNAPRGSSDSAFSSFTCSHAQVLLEHVPQVNSRMHEDLHRRLPYCCS